MKNLLRTATYDMNNFKNFMISTDVFIASTIQDCSAESGWVGLVCVKNGIESVPKMTVHGPAQSYQSDFCL